MRPARRATGRDTHETKRSDIQLIDAAGLAAALKTFADGREWGQFHSPKNLAMALTGEVGELVEHFQWMTEAESRDVSGDPARAQAVGEEIADVLFYLVRLADVLEIDLEASARAKLAVNAAKYPIATARGNSRKYSAAKE